MPATNSMISVLVFSIRFILAVLLVCSVSAIIYSVNNNVAWMQVVSGLATGVFLYVAVDLEGSYSSFKKDIR